MGWSHWSWCPYYLLMTLSYGRAAIEQLSVATNVSVLKNSYFTVEGESPPWIKPNPYQRKFFFGNSRRLYPFNPHPHSYLFMKRLFRSECKHVVQHTVPLRKCTHCLECHRGWENIAHENIGATRKRKFFSDRRFTLLWRNLKWYVRDCTCYIWAQSLQQTIHAAHSIGLRTWWTPRAQTSTYAACKLRVWCFNAKPKIVLDNRHPQKRVSIPLGANKSVIIRQTCISTYFTVA